MLWGNVPAPHRGRDYQYQGDLVRVRCLCEWRSTLARTRHQAYLLWVAHVRQVVAGPRH